MLHTERVVLHPAMTLQQITAWCARHDKEMRISWCVRHNKLIPVCIAVEGSDTPSLQDLVAFIRDEPLAVHT